MGEIKVSDKFFALGPYGIKIPLTEEEVELKEHYDLSVEAIERGDKHLKLFTLSMRQAILAPRKTGLTKLYMVTVFEHLKEFCDRQIEYLKS